MTSFPHPLARSILVAVALTTGAAQSVGAQTGPRPPATPATHAPSSPATTSPSVVPAAPAPAVAAGTDGRAQAQLHFQQGVALYAESNFAAALAEFEAAYKAEPAPTVLYNIGLTYKGLFRYPEAIDALKRYLLEDKDDAHLTPGRKAEIEQSIDEMRSLLAPVTFAVKPASARALVDGRELPLPADGVVQLAAGRHVAELSAEFHQPERREFTVVAGAPLLLTIQLKAIPRSGTAWITSSRPDTRIKIDGQDRGLAPLTVELAVGGHQLEAVAPKYEVFQTEVMLSPGQSRNIDIEMRLPPTQPLYRKWWFWTSIGTAVAGGTATAFLLRPGTAPPTVAELGSAPLNR